MVPFCPPQSDIDKCLKFAKQEFFLGSKHDPNSEMSKLLSVQRQGVFVPELEDLVELPDSCQEVFWYFRKLSNSREMNGDYPQSITFSEMNSFFQMRRIEPLPWEIDLIQDIDILYMNEKVKQINKRMKEATK